ncbi:hypothetical protein BV20DRAFT_808740 [Pilatotrama ljubarskyi]|nr:hypothetical protein BV20DRAFT_808740 [Pilatotrama ljubarskyi]
MHAGKMMEQSCGQTLISAHAGPELDDGGRGRRAAVAVSVCAARLVCARVWLRSRPSRPFALPQTHRACPRSAPAALYAKACLTASLGQSLCPNSPVLLSAPSLLRRPRPICPPPSCPRRLPRPRPFSCSPALCVPSVNARSRTPPAVFLSRTLRTPLLVLSIPHAVQGSRRPECTATPRLVTRRLHPTSPDATNTRSGRLKACHAAAKSLVEKVPGDHARASDTRTTPSPDRQTAVLEHPSPHIARTGPQLSTSAPRIL